MKTDKEWIQHSDFTSDDEVVRLSNQTLDGMLKKLTFYVYIFYCLEVGIFLLVAPWWLPQIWEQNYFFFFVPFLKNLFLNGYFRGAVSGIGILNIFLGIYEIIHNERARRLSGYS